MGDQNIWEIGQGRTNFCQRIPDNHQEDICHNVSLKRREILAKMRKLVDESYNFPICDQWDTEDTLNNTKGPYRFGRIEPANEYKELIGGQLILRCDCGKRNGLQDECRRWNCRGSPKCRITPFPECDPFKGLPSDKSIPAYKPSKEFYTTIFAGPDTCEKCECNTVDF
ncbi:uncharacterized protein LOC142319821 [Lycorma delicatula]|uniref:uncharacterized protein LOC142319821 n=1 Tax=Lycorma delicatula TaxID=130591 RepID=UPI003F50FF4C